MYYWQLLSYYTFNSLNWLLIYLTLMKVTVWLKVLSKCQIRSSLLIFLINSILISIICLIFYINTKIAIKFAMKQLIKLLYLMYMNIKKKMYIKVMPVWWSYYLHILLRLIFFYLVDCHKNIKKIIIFCNKS